MSRALWIVVPVVLAALAVGGIPESAPDPVVDTGRYEFRGAWITSVGGLDWPQSRDAGRQKAELVEMIDALHRAGINAVFFQVRGSSDAFYASTIEPWSHVLGGTQGEAPSPYYDPLEVAIAAAHERGMELHAWFNPLRLGRVRAGFNARNHIARRHPDWVLSTGRVKILDPGIPDVRRYITHVVMDVVRRYDVDGVHFDDYFYPYPPNQVRSQDLRTFRRYNDTRFTNVGDWRRENVDRLIEEVHDSLMAHAPHIKFGVSPFGIWRSGSPAGVSGLSAYHAIFADSKAWLDRRLVDYVVPQLYWDFEGRQDFGKLVNWWASNAGDRHVYVGLGAYNAEPKTADGATLAPGVVPRQIRYSRTIPAIKGAAFYRSANITRMRSGGLADSLRRSLYTRPVLTPPFEWKSQKAPATPQDLTARRNPDGSVVLTWAEPEHSATEIRRYAVYRRDVPGSTARAALDSRNLINVTGARTLRDQPPGWGPWYYCVTSVSANSVESLVAAEIRVSN